MCCTLWAGAADFGVELEKFPRWDNTFNLKTWSGYKDNVLLSHQRAADSPFVAGGLDVLLWRLPENGWECLLLGSGEYIRYVPGGRVDKEISALAQAQVKKDFGNEWKAGLSLEYIYFDQVFDDTLFERAPSAVQVQGNIFTLRPLLRHEWAPGFFTEGEVLLSRQDFRQIVDDEWQAGPRWTFGRNFGHNSEVSLAYQFVDRQFDTRPARDPGGEAIVGKSLEFFQQEFFLTWRQNWDNARRWRSITRLSLQRNDDNAGGYYDYYRARVSQQLRYVAKNWSVRAEAKFTRYQYAIQPVDPENLAHRRKTVFQANIRGERKLSKSVKLFAEYEHERAVSNLTVEAYRANTVSGGIDWEF